MSAKLGMESQNASAPDGSALVEDLLARCNALLIELETFREFIASSNTAAVDIKQFHGPIIAELSSLQRVRLSFCRLKLLAACSGWVSPFLSKISNGAKSPWTR